MPQPAGRARAMPSAPGSRLHALPSPLWGVSGARKVNAQVWAQCCPLQAIMCPQECGGPCGSHRGLQGMWEAETDLREGRGWRKATVSQWAMLLLLLNRPPLQSRGGLGKQRPWPLRSSHSHWALVPPLEAITPSRLQPLDPWGGPGPPSAPTSRGGGQHCLYALQSNNTIFIFGFGQGGAGPWGKPGPRALGCTETLF